MTSKTIVLISTDWGSEHGGINALNHDLATHLAKLNDAGISLKIVCVVPNATAPQKSDAADKGVALRNIPFVHSDESTFAPFVDLIPALLGDLELGPGTIVVGHDAITGPLASFMAKSLPGAQSCVFVHMDYSAYYSMKGPPLATSLAEDKSEIQRRAVSAADMVVAVGPKLRGTARRLGAASKPLYEYIPGLDAEVAVPSPRDRAYLAFLSGRVDPENDVVKQGILAVASFARAIKRIEEAHRADRVQDPIVRIFGVQPNAAADNAQVALLKGVAHRAAERAIAINAHPFENDRQAIQAIMSTHHVALMPSLHDGFGLVGWEAINAGVPLIVSENCGLTRFLSDKALSHLVRAVDIRVGLDYSTVRRASSRARKASLTGAEDDAERYLAAIDKTDLETVSEAIKDNWLSYEKSKFNAISLKTSLLALGFDWLNVVKQFADWAFATASSSVSQAAVPSATIRERSPSSMAIQPQEFKNGNLAVAKSDGADGPTQVRGVDREFEAILARMSDEFVARHVREDVADVVKVERCMASLAGLVTRSGEKLLNPIGTFADVLLSAHQERIAVSLSGYAGGGREQIVSLLYLELRRRIRDRALDLVPVILDRQLETSAGWRLPLEIIRHLDHEDPTRVARLRRYVVLAVGKRRDVESAGRDRTRDLGRLQEHLSRHAASSLYARMIFDEADAGVAIGGSEAIFRIEPSNQDDYSTGSILNLAALAEGISLDNRLCRLASEALASLCRRHRMVPDVFVVRNVLSSVYAGAAAPVSLGSLIGNFVEEFVANRFQILRTGEDKPDVSRQWISTQIRKYSKAHYSFFVGRGVKRRKHLEAHVTNAPLDIDSGFYELVRTHRSIRDWLITHEFCRTMEELGNDALSNAGFADVVAKFDHVFPSRITAFVRDFIEHGETESVESALRVVKTYLEDLVARSDSSSRQRERGLNIRLRKFTTTCIYIAGRVSGTGLREEMRGLLASLMPLARQDLEDFRRLSQLICNAAQAKAPGIRRWAREVFALLGTDVPTSQDAFARAVTRIEREILLLQRGIFISQAMLGDPGAAQRYISDLLLNYANDDLNRGFHREYYGDIEFSPTDPLLSDDRSLSSCDRTLRALLAELPEQRENAPMAQIQLYTVASLVRPRNIAAVISPSDLKLVSGRLATELARHREMPQALSDYVTLTLAEIKFGRFALEAYVDDLYEIKFQTRRGWRALAPPESVGAHQYVVERLAELFIPNHLADGPSSLRSKVFDLVRMHDIGEAITSDKRDQDKVIRDQQLEQSVVARVAQLGALTGSDEFLRTAKCFEEFESVKNVAGSDDSSPAAHAKDLDRLDLLIQLCRYVREHGKINDEDDFRRSTSLERFLTPTIRDRAARFKAYFESEVSRRTDTDRFVSGLWPEGSTRSVRIGEVLE